MLANPGLFKRSRLQWLLNTATLKLPLTNSDTLDSRITATRASTKTYFDSTGTMQTTAFNLLTYSEQFDNAAWTKSNATVSANAVTAPDGTTTADKLMEAATNSTHLAVGAATTVAGVMTASVYAKAGERTFIRIILFDGATSFAAYFNASTGAVGTTTGAVTTTVSNVGGGWYRVVITATTASGVGNMAIRVASADNVDSYLGDGTSGLYVWGAQLETGSTATNYIRTEATASGAFPREYNPSTLVCLGRSFWEARTNLLLNSLIDGTNLSTQSITTTAAARTLSFYGTGTVTLSGTHSATVVGTGAFPTRTTYTYTPTAGTLTLTVSGTVQYANDELGATASPFIPTAGASVTRAADVASMTGTNFSSWYNQTEGTFLTTAMVPYLDAAGTNRRTFDVTDGTSSNRMGSIHSNQGGVTRATWLGATAAVAQFDLNSSDASGNTTDGTFYSSAFAYKVNDFAASHRGNAVLTDTSGTVPTVNQINIGSLIGSLTFHNGFISRIIYWNRRLSNADLQILSR